MPTRTRWRRHCVAQPLSRLVCCENIKFSMKKKKSYFQSEDIKISLEDLKEIPCMSYIKGSNMLDEI